MVDSVQANVTTHIAHICAELRPVTLKHFTCKPSLQALLGIFFLCKFLCFTKIARFSKLANVVSFPPTHTIEFSYVVLSGSACY
jgi:hypothetical protein